MTAGKEVFVIMSFMQKSVKGRKVLLTNSFSGMF